MSNCSECTYLKTNDPDTYGRYWCSTRLERVAANQKECYRFCRNSSISSDDIKKFEKYSVDNSGDPHCYLTTMMCNILKVPDNNPYLNTIRSFRKNILQKDEKYKRLLVEYDIVGPIIANNISKDPKKYTISARAFAKYLKPITEMIRENKNEEAIASYKDMTSKLISFYNIDIIVDDNIIKNTDINESGHGVYKLKKSH